MQSPAPQEPAGQRSELAPRRLARLALAPVRRLPVQAPPARREAALALSPPAAPWRGAATSRRENWQIPAAPLQTRPNCPPPLRQEGQPRSGPLAQRSAKPPWQPGEPASP